MRRREFMRNGFGSIALVCSFGVTDLKRPARNTAAARRAQAQGLFAPFQDDVPLMPTLRPDKRAAKLDTYSLQMRAGTADILRGLQTPVLGYDGLYPGPTIRAKRGRAADVIQYNRSDRRLNVHLHGGVTPPSSDGHPMDHIEPGASRTYHYPNIQPAATLWYHDHSHGETAKTLFAGLAGFYIVSEPFEEELGLPQDQYDVPLMIQDRAFNADGSFRYRTDVDKGYRGDSILVNGALVPRMRVERRRYRLRLLNASNARPYALSLGNGREFVQIGSDAGLLPKPVKRKVITLEPAERVDVVVDFSAWGAGSTVVLQNLGAEVSTSAVMRFDVVRGGAEEFTVPKRLRELEELPEPNAERTFPLTFSGLATAIARPSWQITGLTFGMDRIDARPRRGSTELWHFVNDSTRTHPMHLHGYHFRVVSIDGKAPHAGDAAWKDTVAVLPGQRVSVMPYFDSFSGRYVFHCHAAEHGDMSMMGQMEVVA
jgi:spore coat protein A, manganese oxidase